MAPAAAIYAADYKIDVQWWLFLYKHTLSVVAARCEGASLTDLSATQSAIQMEHCKDVLMLEDK